MLDKLKTIYSCLPLRYLQILRLTPDFFLFGRQYKKKYDTVTQSTRVLDKNIYRVLRYAKENTRFWGEKIPDDYSVGEARQVLAYLPCIGPDDLSYDLDAFVSKKATNANSYRTTTGGTGRNATSIVLSNESYATEWAHMYNIWSLLDYNRFKHKKLTLRGKSHKGGELWQYNPIYNEIVVDTFRLDSANFPTFFNSLKNEKIDYIHAYPSLLKEFADYLEKHQLTFPVKGIFLASEGASDLEKHYFKAFFHCPVVHWYGQTEKVVLAYDIDAKGEFAVFTSYGYPQVNGDYGEIVGTTFVNPALPLINYKTGDYGSLKNGKRLTINNLKGRWGRDFVFLDEEKKIPTTSINLHSNVQEMVLFYQIVQEKYGALEIKIVPKTHIGLSSDSLINLFQEQLNAKLNGFSIQYRISENSELLRSKRGKLLYLVQNLRDKAAT